ncbi:MULTISPECIES: hypothetical protein [unclassified Coleofasciculus]|uniref:hypothetical protein n=1 Tax=unclassified Coleofasciculus TaxID=2692782 RepID=UPI00187F3339|nr:MULTISPECIES: hypothetical protein [unclassified Coleofasciculus]MBE9125991.1 hypothetical protein [Coleofasciculus sp. LEGE 07081]MBE9151185.1 hypothetical protein [Coleofasciculus sp. LEGE 07092]
MDKPAEDNPNISLLLTPIRYRNWLISTKIIDKRLWLQWKHPDENFARYCYPVTERGLTDTIRYARFLIDLIIRLEEEDFISKREKS